MLTNLIEYKNQEQGRYKMPEIQYNLNIGPEGQVNLRTDKIEGSLNSVIFDISYKEPETETEDADTNLKKFYEEFKGVMINPKVDFVIQSIKGYVILDKRQIEGIEYFAPRVRIAPQPEDLRDVLTFDKFSLNEELLITILGPKNTQINVSIRYD